MDEEEREEVDLGFPWLSDEDYAKALWQLRGQLNVLMKVFDCYGLGVHIPFAIAAIVELCEQFGMKVRGDDRPIITRKVKIPDVEIVDDD